MTDAAGSAAIRSLNADFVRRGIVVSAADAQEKYPLDPRIGQVVESLKRTCKASGTKDLSEISSAIQLWKERSLHHTLQTLDEVANGQRVVTASGQASGHERHIQAIELHDKAGREVKEAVMRVVQGIVDTILVEVERFSTQLAGIIRELLKPELEEELERERAIVNRLIAEKHKILEEKTQLQSTNEALAGRVEALENASDGSGDAILCRKLREQVNQLKEKQTEMQTRMKQMELDHKMWRFEMIKMKTETEIQLKTLAMTRAMHDKETEQLVGLVRGREDRLRQVQEATAAALASSTTSVGLTTYDGYSGRNICFKNPPTSSPTKGTKRVPVLATLPTSPPSPRPVLSPNQKRQVSSPLIRTAAPRCSEDEEALLSCACPRGSVRRTFSSQ